MNAVLWVLLAIFIPNAIGIILYFILRQPLPVPCPSCQAPAGSDQAFCARCGTAVRPACPRCRQPVQEGWTHCGRCGATVGMAAPLAAP
jgi:predicted amidophosphoribosyltransferase